MFKKVAVGTRMTDLLVLEKLEQKNMLVLTNKASLIKTAKQILEETDGAQGLPSDISEISVGLKLHGFISNVTSNGGVFVTFANRLTALAPKGELLIQTPLSQILHPISRRIHLFLVLLLALILQATVSTFRSRKLLIQEGCRGN